MFGIDHMVQKMNVESVLCKSTAVIMSMEASSHQQNMLDVSDISILGRAETGSCVEHVSDQASVVNHRFGQSVKRPCKAVEATPSAQCKRFRPAMEPNDGMNIDAAKSMWTDDQKAFLVDCVRRYGADWNDCARKMNAKYIPNVTRTADGCRRMYNEMRKLESSPIDSVFSGTATSGVTLTADVTESVVYVTLEVCDVAATSADATNPGVTNTGSTNAEPDRFCDILSPAKKRRRRRRRRAAFVGIKASTRRQRLDQKIIERESGLRVQPYQKFDDVMRTLLCVEPQVTEMMMMEWSLEEEQRVVEFVGCADPLSAAVWRHCAAYVNEKYNNNRTAKACRSIYKKYNENSVEEVVVHEAPDEAYVMELVSSRPGDVSGDGFWSFCRRMLQAKFDHPYTVDQCKILYGNAQNHRRRIGVRSDTPPEGTNSTGKIVRNRRCRLRNQSLRRTVINGSSFDDDIATPISQAGNQSATPDAITVVSDVTDESESESDDDRCPSPTVRYIHMGGDEREHSYNAWQTGGATEPGATEPGATEPPVGMSSLQSQLNTLKYNERTLLNRDRRSERRGTSDVDIRTGLVNRFPSPPTNGVLNFQPEFALEINIAGAASRGVLALLVPVFKCVIAIESRNLAHTAYVSLGENRERLSISQSRLVRIVGADSARYLLHFELPALGKTWRMENAYRLLPSISARDENAERFRRVRSSDTVANEVVLKKVCMELHIPGTKTDNHVYMELPRVGCLLIVCSRNLQRPVFVRIMRKTGVSIDQGLVRILGADRASIIVPDVARDASAKDVEGALKHLENIYPTDDFKSRFGLRGHQSRVNLDEFVETVDERLRTLCLFCGREFVNAECNSSHQVMRQGKCCDDQGNVFKCRFCSKILLNETGLHSHIIANHCQSLRVKCKICGIVKEGYGAISSHMPSHFPDIYKISCSICGKKCHHDFDLRLHMTKHFGARMYGCSVCRMKFRLPAHLTRHALVHSAEKSCRCELCAFACKTRDHLSRHYIEKHVGCSLRCATCTRDFSTRNAYNKHRRRHLLGLACDTCGHHVSRGEDLCTHQTNVDQGMEPCAPGTGTSQRRANSTKPMSSTTRLKKMRKMNKNDAEYKFPCICGENFVTLEAKVAHAKLSHADEVFCDLCGRFYTTAWRLRKHRKRVHKIIKCRYCQITYSSPAEFREHWRTIHSSTLHKCHCGHVASSRKTLYKHKAEAHSATPIDAEAHSATPIDVCVDETLTSLDYDTDDVRIQTPAFLCADCGARFSDETMLQGHLLQHTLNDIQQEICTDQTNADIQAGAQLCGDIENVQDSSSVNGIIEWTVSSLVDTTTAYNWTEADWKVQKTVYSLALPPTEASEQYPQASMQQVVSTHAGVGQAARGMYQLQKADEIRTKSKHVVSLLMSSTTNNHQAKLREVDIPAGGQQANLENPCSNQSSSNRVVSVSAIAKKNPAGDSTWASGPGVISQFLRLSARSADVPHLTSSDQGQFVMITTGPEQNTRGVCANYGDEAPFETWSSTLHLHNVRPDDVTIDVKDRASDSNFYPNIADAVHVDGKEVAPPIERLHPSENTAPLDPEHGQQQTVGHVAASSVSESQPSIRTDMTNERITAATEVQLFSIAFVKIQSKESGVDHYVELTEELNKTIDNDVELDIRDLTKCVRLDNGVLLQMSATSHERLTSDDVELRVNLESDVAMTITAVRRDCVEDEMETAALATSRPTPELVSKFARVCDICGKMLKNAFARSRHVSKCHPYPRDGRTDVFPCPFCDKRFLVDDYKQQHLKHFHPNYGCDSCPQRFRTLYDRKQHQCLNAAPLTCVPDDLKISSKTKKMSKRENMKKMQIVESTPFKCWSCTGEKRYFANVDDLLEHMRTVHVSIEHVCDICGRGFNKFDYMSRHKVEVHCQIRRFTCPRCDKQFYRGTHLRQHLLLHMSNQVLPYRCDVCTKRYTLADSLAKHMRTQHSQDRPFPCAKCRQRFNTEKRLQTHIADSHCDSVVTCGQCDLVLPDQAALNEHMKHCVGPMFKCQFCGQVFLYNDDILEAHMETHHQKLMGMTHKLDKLQQVNAEARGAVNDDEANDRTELIKLSEEDMAVMRGMGLKLVPVRSVKATEQKPEMELFTSENEGPVEATPQIIAALTKLGEQIYANRLPEAGFQ